jgi:hypothetical protein
MMFILILCCNLKPLTGAILHTDGYNESLRAPIFYAIVLATLTTYFCVLPAVDPEENTREREKELRVSTF